MRRFRWGHVWVPLATVCVWAGTASAETLSAEAALQRAASNNPTLRAALLDAAAARHAVSAEQGARDATFVASLQGEHNENVSRSRGTAVAPGLTGATLRNIQNSLTGNAAVRYVTPSGTELEVGTALGTSYGRTSWSDTAEPRADVALGPTYNADAYASVRQPLLRGAGRDIELAALDQARASAGAAESRADLAASQTALDVLAAYWELWYADRAALVQEQALAVAERLVSDAKVREETLGTGSRVDVLSFSTSAASIADQLSQARAARTTRAIELGRVLGMSPADARALAVSGDPPELGVAPPLEALLRSAREASPRLAALRKDTRRSELGLRTARDADQPRVDLFATASVGTLWDDAAGFSLTGGRPSYGVLGGIEIELPIGGGRYAGDARRAQSELEAAEARYRAEEDAITATVSSLDATLSAAVDQVALATRASEAASELAEAERQRLSLGTTTAQDVVTAEQTRREAELRRLRAVVSQISTRYELEHVTGALLERAVSPLARNSS